MQCRGYRKETKKRTIIQCHSFDLARRRARVRCLVHAETGLVGGPAGEFIGIGDEKRLKTRRSMEKDGKKK